MNSIRCTSLSLKYQRFPWFDCKGKGTRNIKGFHDLIAKVKGLEIYFPNYTLLVGMIVLNAVLLKVHPPNCISLGVFKMWVFIWLARVDNAVKLSPTHV